MSGINLHNETKVGLLYALEALTERVTGDMPLPVKRQSQDGENAPKPRAAAVFKARLPDMTSFQKKAPFILHQVVTGDNAIKNANKGTGQQIRRELIRTCVVRSVFCVYHPDEQEGGLALLNLMEKMEEALLLFPILDKVFELDLDEGISQMIYPETGERGTAPFYLGEMVTVWKLPAIKRLDAARVTHGLPPTDPKAAHYIDKRP